MAASETTRLVSHPSAQVLLLEVTPGPGPISRNAGNIGLPYIIILDIQGLDCNPWVSKMLYYWPLPSWCRAEACGLRPGRRTTCMCYVVGGTIQQGGLGLGLGFLGSSWEVTFVIIHLSCSCLNYTFIWGLVKMANDRQLSCSCYGSLRERHMSSGIPYIIVGD
jgi:hypothetical protein